LYASERLTRQSAEAANAFEYRDNRLHAEDGLSAAERAELADYVRSGCDRGHMAPSGDMTTREDDFASFSLANIVPQAGGLNRSGWASLEGYVRLLAVTFDEAYVVTGPAYQVRSFS
jgi:endonuclease G